MRNRHRINYVLDWVQYIQCTRCLEVKSIDMFCKAKRWLFWKREKCKECEKKYREEHRDRITEYLRNYYHSNIEENQKKHAEYREKNRERIREREREHYREIFEEVKEKRREERFWEKRWDIKARQKSKRLIRKLWIRPDKCGICWWSEFRIEAHHPDYSKWNEIVFCCKSCHLLIHSWKIKCPKTIDLCLIKQNV